MMTRTGDRSTNQKLNILIVEDSDDYAELLADLLREHGHSVRTAPSGAEALALIAENIPHTVLLDVGLPDMFGYELAQKIRARYQNTIRVIALTGYSGSDELERARSAGCDKLLTKPVPVSEIEAALHFNLVR